MEVSFRPQTINYSLEFFIISNLVALSFYLLKKKRDERAYLPAFVVRGIFFSSSNSRSEFNYQTIKYLQRRLSTSESVNHTSIQYSII